MEFRFTPEQEDFRASVRAFIERELPSGWGGLDGKTFEQQRTFQRALAARKWYTMAWPVEFGGLDADTMTQMIFREEMGRFGTPGYTMGPAFSMAVAWVGPAIMAHGTDEQRARFLPGIASADDFYCTLYSEPEAGSDLAALRTRVHEDGDEFVINGQKLWTSHAHYADWGWLAARTDPSAPKHRGISTFVVPMDAPGVTIRPIINMAGHHSFNEVFFDDVRIPRSNLIGGLNQGWGNLAAALDLERSGIEWNANARRRLDEIIDFARADTQVWRSSEIRTELAQRATEAEVGRLLCYRFAQLHSEGRPATREASASKLFNSELSQRVAQTGMKVFGMFGTIAGQYEPLDDSLTHVLSSYLFSVASSIGAGSSEIQRNIIAKQLGLPR